MSQGPVLKLSHHARKRSKAGALLSCHPSLLIVGWQDEINHFEQRLLKMRNSLLYCDSLNVAQAKKVIDQNAGF